MTGQEKQNAREQKEEKEDVTMEKRGGEREGENGEAACKQYSSRAGDGWLADQGDER